jgi:hypothetical protein
MGGGQTQPMNMDNAYNTTNVGILDKLNGMESFTRLGKFSTGRYPNQSMPSNPDRTKQVC